MMRAFLHVDEFGEHGMAYLPHLACLSDPLVVWGPSPRLLEATPGFISPRDLLSLVDRSDAPVRIIGRENWLLDKQFRNSHPWPLAAWVEDFDGVLKRLALEDQSKPIPGRRVIVAEPEEGYAKADEILDSPNGEKVAKQLRRLYNAQRLPVGILDKARRARAKRESVPRTILRDVYNHARAIGSAHALVAMTPSEHMAVLHGIVSDPLLPGVTTFDPPGKGYVTAADLREAAQVLRRVKPILSMPELEGFLESGLKSDLHDLMYSPRSTSSLDAHLVQQVNQATVAQPFFKHLFRPNDPIALTLTIGGLALGITSLLLTGHLEWS